MGEQTTVYCIDGASTFSEVKDFVDAYNLGNINPEYKFAMINEGDVWVSKNAKEWVWAISVEISGQQVLASEEFMAAVRKREKERKHEEDMQEL